jgi:hypothetical protein
VQREAVAVQEILAAVGQGGEGADVGGAEAGRSGGHSP